MNPGSGGDAVTLLFTCVGRRVELLQCFRAAAARQGIRLRLIGSDLSPTAPALACVDEAHLTPRIDDDAYIPALLDIIRRSGARALIPTIDTELPVLSAHREALTSAGCLPLVAAPEPIRVCRDKLATYEFLHAHGVDTPATHLPPAPGGSNPLPYPFFLKPRFGSASVGAHVIRNQQEQDYCLSRVPEAIFQEYVEGEVYTLDAYTGLRGAVRCVVPRLRLAVRTGEVARGVVVKDRRIMDAGRKAAETLGPSALGMLTLQCVVSPQGRISFIDINPRFGGGAPMGVAAGADYPAWLLEELRGGDPQIAFDGFRHGLCMSRYDWSVFTQLDGDLKLEIRPPLNRFPDFDPPRE